MSTPPVNKNLWNLLVVLVVVLGGAVSLLVVNKEHYLPSLASSHRENHEESNSSELSQADTANVKNVDSEGTTPEQVQNATPITEARVEQNTGRYLLVAGSFLSEERAKNYQSVLRQNFERSAPEILAVNRNENIYYRVIAFRSEDEKEIISLKNEMAKAGYEDCWYYWK